MSYILYVHVPEHFSGTLRVRPKCDQLNKGTRVEHYVNTITCFSLFFKFSSFSAPVSEEVNIGDFLLFTGVHQNFKTTFTATSFYLAARRL